MSTPSTGSGSNAASAASLEMKVNLLVSMGLPAELAKTLLAQTQGDLSTVLAILGEGEGQDEDEEAGDGDDEAGDQSTPAPPAQPQLFTGPDGSRHSVVQLHGSHSSTCGYCHAKTRGRASYGLTAAALTCSDYQALIDAGWRRSGDYCYRPDNEKGCCPNWTIRLKVSEFVKNKAQKKVERRMRDWLDRKKTAERKDRPEGEEEKDEQMDDGEEGVERKEAEDPNITALRRAIITSVVALQSNDKLQTRLTETILGPQLRVYLQPQRKPRIKQPSSSAPAPVQHATSTTSTPLASYSTNIAFLLASASKEITVALLPLAAAELMAQQLNSGGVQCSVTAPGYINFDMPATATLGSVRRKSSASTPRTAASSAHIAAAPAQPARQLTVTQVPATYTREAFEVFERYQREVHGEGTSPSRYTSFLCTSPLVSDDPEYGAFHHHYRVDGKLIAVGVVDILPLCLSSVYLFYDPAYHHLSLGIYTALAEIDWVQRFQLTHPRCEYYYLGYTIVTCAKMLYKSTFKPPQLLCDIRWTWHSMDECMRWLKHNKYVVFSDTIPQWKGPADAAQRLADEQKSQQLEAAGQKAAVTPETYTVSERTREEVKARLARLTRDVLPRVPLVYQRKLIRYEQLAARMPSGLRALITQYVELVGDDIALRIAVQVQ